MTSLKLNIALFSVTSYIHSQILFAAGPKLPGSAQCHIHVSRLKDLVYRFDITGGNAGRQCENTHICLD